MTSESEGRDHWLELVEKLGIEPVAEDSQPSPSSQVPSSPLPVARSPREMPRKPAPPRPSSGWSELAGQFGIELPPEEPEVERPARVVRPIPDVERSVAQTPAAMPPAAPSHAVTPPAEPPTGERTPVDRPFPQRRTLERPSAAHTPDEGAERDWRPADQEVADRTTSLPAEDRGPVEKPIAESRDARPAWNEPEARLEDLPGYVEPPAMLDDSDTLEEMLSFRDQRQAEMEGDDYASEPAVRRRRRRRGNRRDEESPEVTESEPAKAEAREFRGPESRMPESRGPESVEDVKVEAEQDEDSDEDSAASSDESPRESVVRRRRRRRRRRGGEEREAGEARVSGGEARPVESSVGKPRATESDDETDDTDLEDDFADASSADDQSDDQSDEAGAARHRKIPTWEDAVTVVIDANLQSRSRSGGNSRGGDARGGGGGGGRRRGRR